jgi:segregation and condensation protein B
LYGTTTRFLEQFGLNSLDDLPTLREIEELLDEPHFDEERAQLLALESGDGAPGEGDTPDIAPNGAGDS